jgi:hypothetical protein
VAVAGERLSDVGVRSESLRAEGVDVFEPGVDDG